MIARRAAWQTTPPRRFSRRWFLDALRTAAWVAAITVLIWVYADIYFTKEDSATVTLRIHTDSDPDVALVAPYPDVKIQVHLKLRGRGYAVDQFGGMTLSYDAAKGREPGLYPKVDTAALLKSLPVVRNSGVEILSARPRAIPIHLEKLESIGTVAVRLDCINGQAVEVKLEPERVEVRVPSTLAEKYRKDKPEVVTRTADLADRPAGQRVTMELALRRPDIPGCRLSHRSVKAIFTVGHQPKRQQFTVPVTVLMPKNWLDDDTWSKYRLEAKPTETWMRTITVEGDPIDVDGLTAEKFRACIVLTEADKDRAREGALPMPHEVNVEILQPSVRLADEKIPPVVCRLVKRSGP